MATVTKLPLPKSGVSRYPAVKPRAKRTARHQLATAAAVGTVAVTLTGLSLNHLASGIAEITHASPWQAWATAIGVDCGFVAVELAGLVTSKARTVLAKSVVAGTLSWSAALNALAFAGPAEGQMMQVAAITLGLSIPALIYALTKIGAAIYLDAAH